MTLAFIFALFTLAAFVYVGFELKLLLGYLATRRSHERPRPHRLARPPAGSEYPKVLVQISIFNEGAVGLSVVGAAGRLTYPRDRLEIQVLDDSTDETPRLLAPCIARLREEGINISHLRREHREGWKAGALAWGLSMSDAEFVALFDADFLPPKDFLLRGIVDSGVFEDQDVAFVQGRWTYTNSGQSVLTRAQAILMDRHFAIQKPYQLINRRTLTFNGSAGIWRRQAIDVAGGWTSDTLCEDLDLSYRTAFAGLRGHYDYTLVCPSEIPASILAFKIQQRRWAKGTAQCLRKLGTRIFASKQMRYRWEDFYSMAGYMVHPIMLGHSILWPWIVLETAQDVLLTASQVCMTTANVVVIAGLMMSTMVMGRDLRGGLLRDLPFALLLGMALMVNTTVAFLTGFFEKRSVFERTPKQGAIATAKPTAPPPEPLHWSIGLEFLFLLYMAWMTLLLLDGPWPLYAVSTLLFSVATGYIIVAQLAERLARTMPESGPIATVVQDSEFVNRLDTTPFTMPKRSQKVAPRS